jgi:carboxymethylenebutenolidase
MFAASYKGEPSKQRRITMQTEKVLIRVAGEPRPMGAYLAVPEGQGPFAAVIVFEEIYGVNSHIREVTERVAKEGYVAIAPDIHHRSAPGIELSYDQAGAQKGMPLIGKLTESGVIADVTATTSFLRGRSDVRADRIGCMGFCIGGHIAYLTAATSEVKVTASFYGGGIATRGLGAPNPTVSRTSSIKGRILCFFGGQDQSIPYSQVQQIKKALEDHRIRHEVVVYEDAGHGFFCDQRGSYQPKAAADAWERTKRLFAEELAGR